MKKLRNLVVSIIFLLLLGCYSIPDLQQAAMDGDIGIIRQLVKEKKDVNERNIHGYTALHYAVLNCRLNVVKELIANGAQPELSLIYGKTLLHYIRNCNTLNELNELITFLIKSGIDPNEGDQAGITPLHRAAKYDFGSAAKILLDAGVSVNKLNAQGLTPRDIACLIGSENVIKILDEYGGQSNKYPSTTKSVKKAEVIGVKSKISPGSIKYIKSEGFGEVLPGLVHLEYVFFYNEGWYVIAVYLKGEFIAEPGRSYNVDLFGGYGDFSGKILDKETGWNAGYMKQVN